MDFKFLILYKYVQQSKKDLLFQGPLLIWVPQPEQNLFVEEIVAPQFGQNFELLGIDWIL